MEMKLATIAEKEATSSIEDRALGQKIIRNLKTNAVTDLPSPVEILVKAGVVHFYGNVAMQGEKQLVEEIVRLTKGVVSVHNHLEITPAPEKGRCDETDCN